MILLLTSGCNSAFLGKILEGHPGPCGADGGQDGDAPLFEFRVQIVFYMFACA